MQRRIRLGYLDDRGRVRGLETKNNTSRRIGDTYNSEAKRGRKELRQGRFHRNEASSLFRLFR